MTFLELAEKILSEEKSSLTANEIWQTSLLKGYDKMLKSVGKTPWATLGAQLYVNSKDNPKSIFSRTDTRPKRFFLKAQASQIDLKKIPSKDLLNSRRKSFTYKEADLHSFLSYYSYYHLNSYTKTINHTQSLKKEFGQWVHPDMVGCYFPFDDWKAEVYDLSSVIGNISIKLYSFELKRELAFGNLRESFFQTVSNSSWANESYLVAVEISNDPDFLDELSRLSSSFGIGIIKLNINDPHSTEIIFPAKFKVNLDWDTINKLATMNVDFEEFITTVKIDINSKKIHKKEYNTILEIDELDSMLSKCQ